MNHRHTAVAATVLALTMSLSAAAQTAMTGVGRVDLLQKDSAIPGKELIQARVDFGHDALAPRHSHPGEEIAFVLKGTLQYQIDGQPPVTLHAGQSLFIPAGAVHSARNIGGGESQELATYVVEKGKPLVVLAK
ncbi:quercetin dioxygenase-like cupin family protein [Pseudoduganella flava]|uniref:Quercetin dioxygenase-like cupin family protein n=2 Tax=Pseudoduganella flava TaxID=871742 RepID=A0A562PIA0_9BURK|nr:cupin domain-containing protein [Pseudoduganella flava]TWI43960.1 quercetin dioxygenase-like cupin family protein [Pseudoduganella flava]